MIAPSSNQRIFVCTQPTDMRKSFNGLSGLVSEHFPVELLSGHLFLFFNRKRDSAKILAWDRDGLMLWYMSLNEELPNDLAACHARIEELQQLDQQHDEIVERLAQDNQLLRFELEQLKRYLRWSSQ